MIVALWAAVAVLSLAVLFLFFAFDTIGGIADQAHRRIDEWKKNYVNSNSELSRRVDALDKDVEYIECWLESQGWEFHPAEEPPARWVKAKKS